MKNKIKKTIYLLTAASIFPFSQGVFADYDVSLPPLPNPEYDYKCGTAAQITSDRLTLNIDDEMYIFNYSKDTEIIDNDLMPISEDEIKSGTSVLCVHKPIMTMSIPPQLPAEMFIVSKTSEPLPIYAEVIFATDNVLSVQSQGTLYSLDVTDECAILPYKTKNIITFSDFSEGDRILFYADKITKSIPAYSVPSKIIMLENKLSDTIADDDFINREKFCDLLYCELKNSGIVFNNTENLPFKDTDSEAVLALYNEKIVKGVNEAEFMPDKLLSREELAVLIDRATKYAGLSIVKSTDLVCADDTSISEWAKNSVYKILDYDIISYENGAFLPQSNVTQKEAKQAIYKLCSLL